MTDALLLNAAILVGIVLVLWALSVAIDDVSFIDAFWGAGMAVMAITSWLQLPDRGPAANLLLGDCAWASPRHLSRALVEGRGRPAIQAHDAKGARERVRRLRPVGPVQDMGGAGAAAFPVSSPAQVGILWPPKDAG